MYLKYNFQIKALAAILIALFIFVNFYRKTSHLDDDFFQKLVVKFYLIEFEGVVTERYVDEKNHGYRKVVFKDSNKYDVLYLNFENDDIFKSFNVRDSIFKKPNTLDFLIKRNSESFIKKFNFDNYVDRDDYDENLDSIIFDYLNKRDATDLETSSVRSVKQN